MPAPPAPGGRSLSHLDERGSARMVDVSEKSVTLREATASGRVRMRPATLRAITRGGVPKGDVFSCARIAAIMAAKETHRLIPLCHPLPLSEVHLEIAADGRDAVLIQSRVRTVGRTGVEMEALVAVSVAALTVYDMCKAIDRGMEIEQVRLESKKGGRSGEYQRSIDGNGT